jgi:hypothetical protein
LICVVTEKIDLDDGKLQSYPKSYFEKYKPSVSIIDAGSSAILQRCGFRTDLGQTDCDSYKVDHIERTQGVNITKFYYHRGQFDVQVFSNLILNAFQAMEGTGCLTVKSGSGDGSAFAEIGDTGPGIPPEHPDQLFLPFFTTKPGEQGTGLGLYITRDIVADAGGSISVKSSPGSTIFRVEFPETA